MLDDNQSIEDAILSVQREVNILRRSIRDPKISDKAKFKTRENFFSKLRVCIEAHKNNQYIIDLLSKQE